MRVAAAKSQGAAPTAFHAQARRMARGVVVVDIVDVDVTGDGDVDVDVDGDGDLSVDATME